MPGINTSSPFNPLRIFFDNKKPPLPKKPVATDTTNASYEAIIDVALTMASCMARFYCNGHVNGIAAKNSRVCCPWRKHNGRKQGDRM